MGRTLQFTVGMIGNVTCLVMYTVPIITFRRVIKKNSTENFSCLPYVVAFFNGLLYTFYGMPLISVGTENVLVSTVNGIGTVLELIYVTIFLVYSPPKAKRVAVRMVVGVLLAFATVAAVSVLALDTHSEKKMLVGTIGVVVSVLMYAAPLSVMKLVIKTKSVEFMPFYLSLFSFINSTVWLIYGALGRDVYVGSPNFVGTPLGLLQLVLHCIYRKHGACNYDPEKGQEESEETKVEKARRENGHAFVPPDDVEAMKSLQVAEVCKA